MGGRKAFVSDSISVALVTKSFGAYPSLARPHPTPLRALSSFPHVALSGRMEAEKGTGGRELLGVEFIHRCIMAYGHAEEKAIYVRRLF